MNYLQPYAYCLILSFILSLLVYLRPSPFYLKLFPPFLFISSCIEIYAEFLQSKSEFNIHIYNRFSVFEFIFYITILGIVTTDKKWKRIMFVSAVLYGIIGYVYLIFFLPRSSFHSTTYSLGSLLVVTFCIYYFLELFRLAKWDRLSNNPAFWICAGLLFFYVCGFFYFGLMNYWGYNPRFRFLMKYFAPITNILNIALYSLFAIAFLCNRTRKYTLSSS